MIFPRLVYRGPAVSMLVHDIVGYDKALSEGWNHGAVDAAAPANPIGSNSESAEDTKPQEAAAPSREALIAALEAFDIEVDKRWGEKRLAAELAKAKGAQDAA